MSPRWRSSFLEACRRPQTRIDLEARRISSYRFRSSRRLQKKTSLRMSRTSYLGTLSNSRTSSRRRDLTERRGTLTWPEEQTQFSRRFQAKLRIVRPLCQQIRNQGIRGSNLVRTWKRILDWSRYLQAWKCCATVNPGIWDTWTRSPQVVSPTLALKTKSSLIQPPSWTHFTTKTSFPPTSVPTASPPMSKQSPTSCSTKFWTSDRQTPNSLKI